MCARSWWLGSYRELRPVRLPQTGPLPFGSRIHLVLEATGKTGEWDREAIRARWNKAMDHEIKLATENGGWVDDLRKEAKMGAAMLVEFVSWLEEIHYHDRYEIIGVESKFGEYIPIKLPDGQTIQMLFRGKLDIWVRRRSDGAMLVVDYKTAANLSERTLAAQEMSNQGPLYMALMMLSLRGQPQEWAAGVQYLMLRKVGHTSTAKPPFYALLDVPISNDRIKAAMTNLAGKARRVVAMTQELDAGGDPMVVAPYSVGWWCDSCPFKTVCNAMQRGLPRAEEMLEANFVKGDIWERYSRDEKALSDLL